MADTDLPIIVPAHDGTPRMLACLEPYPNFGGFRTIHSAFNPVPRSEWRDIDLSPFLHPVWDQGQHGSCVGHGSATAYHLAYRIAGGTVPPSGFSPTSLYALVNNGRDRGAVVSDAMDALINHGLATMAEVPESIIYESQIPASAKATRKRFRALDSYHCESFDALVSAIQLGFPVSFGIMIRTGWNSPRSTDGMVPEGGRVIGGHCCCAYGVVTINGKWYVMVRNSWSDRYGKRGNILLSEWHFDAGGPLDAFAIRATLADPQDANPAPVAAS